jgi:hypothetical protein
VTGSMARSGAVWADENDHAAAAASDSADTKEA